MKKVFNLSVILAVLMAAFSFTSCSDDDDDSTIEISKIEGQDSYTIKAEAGIKSITVYQVSGSEESKLKAESEAYTSEFKGKELAAVSFAGYADGTYKIAVEDKDGNQKSKTVTVGAGNEGGDDDVTCNKDELSVKAGDVIFYEHGTQKGQFTVVSASANAITLENVLGNSIELSDAGASYIGVNGTAIKLAAAKEAGEIILAKVNGKAMVAGGASSELQTQFAKNATKLGK